MNNKFKFFIFITLCMGNLLFAKWSFDLETGVVKSGYNNVRIPGKDGTKFSLKNDIPLDESVFFRLEFVNRYSNNRGLRFLYAPLTLEGDGKLTKDIEFKNKTFLSGSDVNALYQFNSYRLTYFRSFCPQKNLNLDFGITGKVRYAKIRIKDNNQVAEKTDLGFVPLIYLNMKFKMNEKCDILFGGDMLVAPQGRAEDILTAITYQVSQKVKLKTGYRFLEGGADNDEVYTFAFVNYFVIGATIEF